MSFEFQFSNRPESIGAQTIVEAMRVHPFMGSWAECASQECDLHATATSADQFAFRRYNRPGSTQGALIVADFLSLNRAGNSRVVCQNPTFRWCMSFKECSEKLDIHGKNLWLAIAEVGKSNAALADRLTCEYDGILEAMMGILDSWSKRFEH